MDNIFYSLEDGCYKTYPDGDEATGNQIREVLEDKEKAISKLQQENEKLKSQLEVGEEQYNDLVEEKEKLQEQLSSKTLKLEEYEEEARYSMTIVEHNKLVSNIVKENKQLKDDWNKLKEYIRKTKLKEFEKSYGRRYGKTFTQAEVILCNMITNYMQELEKGNDSNE